MFQKKRKQFDSAEHRVNEEEQAKFSSQAKRNNYNASNQPKNNAKAAKGGKNANIPKWKADSLAFRAVLKQNRSEGLTKEESNMMQKVEAQKEDSMVKCPYCGRTFNEQAGNRHISFCEQQAKKKGIKKR